MDRRSFMKKGALAGAATAALAAPEVDPETGAVTAPATQPWYEQVASSVAAADDPTSAQ